MKKLILTFIRIKLVKKNLQGSGRALLLLIDTIKVFPHIWFRHVAILNQMYITGVKSLFVVSMVAVFSGMVIGLQMGLALKQYGQQEFIGQVVIIVLAREFSPFLTALILTAAVGSSITAELGTMKVSEEIDALKVMSIHFISYLVFPRMLGFTIMLPILAVYSTVLGVFGAGVVANTQLGVEVGQYTAMVNDILRSSEGLKDIWVGLLKSLAFGVIISTISCHQGLNAEGGAIGVGIAVRRAVMHSFLFVLIIGYYISNIFYIT